MTERAADWGWFVISLILLPVLFVQGIVTGLRAEKLPEPDGPRSGNDGDGPEIRLMVLGDSSAAGVGVTTQYAALAGQLSQRFSQQRHVSWRVLAKTGATTADTLQRLEQEADWHCDLVVIGLGVNDVTHARLLGRWLKDYRRLLDLIAQKCGKPTVLVSGLPPVGRFPALPQPLRRILGQRAQMFDRHLKQLTSDRHACHYLQFDMSLHPDMMAADGFHPGPDVYARWADVAFSTWQRIAPPPIDQTGHSA